MFIIDEIKKLMLLIPRKFFTVQSVNPKREYIVGAGGAALYLVGGATDDWAKVRKIYLGFTIGIPLRGMVRNCF